MRKLKLHEMLIGATNLVGGAGGGGRVSVESPLVEAEGQLLGPCQASSDLKSNLKPRCLEDT